MNSRMTIALAAAITLGLGTAAMAQSYRGDGQARGRSSEAPYSRWAPDAYQGAYGAYSAPRGGYDANWKIRQDSYNDETGINNN